MNENKYIALALKLKELSEKGIGGEKINAQEKLRLIMRKYNISEDDINQGIRRSFDLYCQKDMPVRFLRQILASIVGSISDYGCNIYQYRHAKKRGFLRYQLENIEPHVFSELDIKVNAYWQHYNKQLEMFYDAFIQKNELYQKPDENQSNSGGKKLTPEERAYIFRMQQMMEGLEKLKINKQIEA